MIDVLRDYRFYDIDLAHPNYMATDFVLEKFAQSCIEEEAQELMKEIRKIMIARKHKAFQPHTNAHKQFLESHVEKVRTLAGNTPSWISVKNLLTSQGKEIECIDGVFFANPVNSFLMIGLSRPQNRIRKGRYIDCTGVNLGFQTKTGKRTILFPVISSQWKEYRHRYINAQ